MTDNTERTDGNNDVTDNDDLADISDVLDEGKVIDGDDGPVKIAPLKTSILRPTMLVAGLLVIILVMKVSGPVLGPLFLFAVLALLVAPLFQMLRAKGVSAGLALVIMLVGIVGVTLGLGLIVVVSFKQLLQGLEAYNQSFQVNTEVLNQWGQSLKMGG